MLFYLPRLHNSHFWYSRFHQFCFSHRSFVQDATMQFFFAFTKLTEVCAAPSTKISQFQWLWAVLLHTDLQIKYSAIIVTVITTSQLLSSSDVQTLSLMPQDITLFQKEILNLLVNFDCVLPDLWASVKFIRGPLIRSVNRFIWTVSSVESKHVFNATF